MQLMTKLNSQKLSLLKQTHEVDKNNIDEYRNAALVEAKIIMLS